MSPCQCIIATACRTGFIIFDTWCDERNTVLRYTSTIRTPKLTPSARRIITCRTLLGPTKPNHASEECIHSKMSLPPARWGKKQLICTWEADSLHFFEQHCVYVLAKVSLFVWAMYVFYSPCGLFFCHGLKVVNKKLNSCISTGLYSAKGWSRVPTPPECRLRLVLLLVGASIFAHAQRVLGDVRNWRLFLSRDRTRCASS